MNVSYKTDNGRIASNSRGTRNGNSLLLCLFVMALTSLILLGMLDTSKSQMAALNNTSNYERALYLAGAGAHHALAEIEADPNWRTGIAATEFPAGSGDTYSSTAADGAGGTVVITSAGTSGSVTRSLQVTIQPGG